MGFVTVLNNTDFTIQVSVTSHSSKSGGTKYYPIKPGGTERWERYDLETVLVWFPGPDKRTDVYTVPPGETLAIAGRL
jgi:hypothetical protein